LTEELETKEGKSKLLDEEETSKKKINDEKW
jgi:hypothetical protein